MDTSGEQRAQETDLTTYQYTLQRVLQADREQSHGETLAALLRVRAHGDFLVAQHDYARAFALYQSLLSALTEHASGFPGSYDDFLSALCASVDALFNLLRILPETYPLRLPVCACLFSICRYDLSLGGLGLNDYIADGVCEFATLSERLLFSDWVAECITGSTAWQDRLREQWWSGFWLRLRSDMINDDDYIRVGRQTGRFSDVIVRLLAARRLSEALTLLDELSSYDLYYCCNAFWLHGYAYAYENYLYERASQTHNMLLIQRLYEYYQQQADYEKALCFAKVIFLRRPTLELYRRMRATALLAGCWQELRAAMLQYVRQIQAFALEVYIALEEHDLDHALALIMGRQDYGEHDFLYGRGPVILSVARAVQDANPYQALTLYRYHISFLLEHRGREYYRAACRYLAVMKTLYEHLGQLELWREYLHSLQHKYYRLRAFKDEMRRARLEL